MFILTPVATATTHARIPIASSRQCSHKTDHVTNLVHWLDARSKPRLLNTAKGAQRASSQVVNVLIIFDFAVCV
jgi:hypothetical protein